MEEKERGEKSYRQSETLICSVDAELQAFLIPAVGEHAAIACCKHRDLHETEAEESGPTNPKQAHLRMRVSRKRHCQTWFFWKSRDIVFQKLAHWKLPHCEHTGEWKTLFLVQYSKCPQKRIMERVYILEPWDRRRRNSFSIRWKHLINKSTEHNLMARP